MATSSSEIERIMSPDAVAIVGASTDETKRGHQAIVTLQEEGYEGDIYPVNPTENEIRGLEVYPTVSEIPGRVDLALIVTPASIVPNVLADCGETDLAGAIVVAVGFGESDEAGENLEEEIVSVANKQGIRLIGPNTSGMINVYENLNLVGTKNVPEGNLALLCQSGNMAISLFTEATTREGVGYSHYVGVGNEADLKFHEYLSFYESNQNTEGVVCYVEGMNDGRSFLKKAREVATETPIIALKSGQSSVGKRSASSHTGALAGNNKVADATLRQAGVITVNRSDELLAVSNALSSLSASNGSNVGILADGGGHATLAADALAERGLSVPELNKETKSDLEKILPKAASVVNPVDVAGGTDDDQRVFIDCAKTILEDSSIDALLLTGLFGGYGIRFSEQYTETEIDVASELATLSEETDTPIVVQSAYEGFDTEPHHVLRESNIPVFESIDMAATSLTALADYGSHLKTANKKSNFQMATDNGAASVVEKMRNGRKQLSEWQAKQALTTEGLPVAPFKLVTSPDEAQVAATEFDGSIAMKVSSPDIIHKSEADGIALEIDETNIKKTYNDLIHAGQNYDPNAEIDGVLVSPMRDTDVELIVGVIHDEQFGPVIMLGLGGIFVEVLEDIAFRALPLTETDARALINDLDSQEILDGARGNEPVDRDSIVDFLLSVSKFVESNPSVSELDLNPVFASNENIEIIDATITFEDENSTTVDGTAALQEVDND